MSCWVPPRYQNDTNYGILGAANAILFLGEVVIFGSWEGMVSRGLVLFYQLFNSIAAAEKYLPGGMILGWSGKKTLLQRINFTVLLTLAIGMPIPITTTYHLYILYLANHLQHGAPLNVMHPLLLILID